MKHLWRTATCAFLFYGSVLTTGRKHLRPFLLLLRVRPLVWLAHMTFGSELWDFKLKCQAFLWRIPRVSKVCPSTIWHLLMVITDKRWAGSRKFKAVYKRALSLEKKMTFGLNALVEKLSSWVMITCSHGICEDMLLDAITLEQYRKLWVKTRDSVHTVLVTLKNELAAQAFYLSNPPLASTRCISVIKRWLMDLVCFSWYYLCFFLDTISGFLLLYYEMNFLFYDSLLNKYLEGDCLGSLALLAFSRTY